MNMRVLKSLVIAAILLAPLMLTGCNTVAGAGQDLTGAAKTVQQKL